MRLTSRTHVPTASHPQRSAHRERWQQRGTKFA